MADYFLSIISKLAPSVQWRIWPIDANTLVMDYSGSSGPPKIVVDVAKEKMWLVNYNTKEVHFNLGDHDSVVSAFKAVWVIGNEH